MNITRKQILIGSLALAGALTLAACGYVKVFNGQAGDNFTWSADKGYQAQIPDSEAVATCAGSLTSANITFATGDTASAVTTNFTVPTTVGECTVAWTSDTAGVVDISSSTATVTRPFQATDATVTLTATLTRGTATETKTFPVVVKRQVSDAEAVATCKANLSESSITFGSGDTSTNVTQNFTLPLVQNDCTVAWVSSDSSWAAVSGANATVTRKTSGTNGSVTLTATISRNLGSGAADTKDLSITVIRQLTDAEAVALCVSNFSATPFTFGTGDSLTNINGSFTGPTTQNDCTVTWSKTGGLGWMTISSGSFTVVPQQNATDQTGTITATIARGTASDPTKTFAATIKRLTTNGEYADACAAAFNSAYFQTSTGQTATAITASFTLPTTITVNSKQCDIVTWASANSAISITGSAATVSRPLNSGSNATGNLTATAQYSGQSGSSSGITLSTTVSKLTAQDTVDSDLAAVAVGLNGNSSLNDIRTSIILAPAGSKGSTITWTSSDTNHIPSGSGTLTVVRGHLVSGASPAYTAVTLTAAVSYAGATTQNTSFSLRVTPLGFVTQGSGGLVNTACPSAGKLNVSFTDVSDSDLDSSHFDVTEYWVCISTTASLTTISALEAALGPTLKCKNPGISGTAQFTGLTAGTTWYANLYAKGATDPIEDHHKFLYSQSNQSCSVQ